MTTTGTIGEHRRLSLTIVASIFATAAAALLAMPSASAATAEWTQIEESEFDFLFLGTEADFSGYNKILIDPLSVWHTGDRVDEQQLARLRESFTTSFARNFEQAGFAVAQEPGDGVIRLHVEIIDLKTGVSGDVLLNERFLFDVAPGRITLVADLCDALSGEVLLRIADLEKAPPYEAAGPVEETAHAFAVWSAHLGGVLLAMSNRAASDSTLVAHGIAD